MTKKNFDKCFDMLLQHEGGFVNHPEDPGGATNHGVTKRVMQQLIVMSLSAHSESDLWKSAKIIA